MTVSIHETAAARALTTVTGRLVGDVYEWTNSDVHTLLLQTTDGETTPLIVHGPGLFKQCKRHCTLIVEGERNTTNEWGLYAGTAIIVATIRRS
jgi:hypothetical protein